MMRRICKAMYTPFSSIKNIYTLLFYDADTYQPVHPIRSFNIHSVLHIGSEMTRKDNLVGEGQRALQPAGPPLSGAWGPRQQHLAARHTHWTRLSQGSRACPRVVLWPRCYSDNALRHQREKKTLIRTRLTSSWAAGKS